MRSSQCLPSVRRGPGGTVPERFPESPGGEDLESLRVADPENVVVSGHKHVRLAVSGKDAVFWDRELPGFGVRVYPTGRKVYVVRTRTEGRSKRVTVGLHGELTADQARNEAARLIARIKAGEPLVGKESEAEKRNGG